MATVKKPDIAKIIASEFGTPKKQALEMLDRIFEIITEEMANKGEVYISHFGFFSAPEYLPKARWDVVQDAKVYYPTKFEPRFRPNKELREKCNSRS